MSVLGKLTSLKANNGESMLQFICKKIKNENEEFPAKLKELKDIFSTRKTDLDVTQSKARELDTMVQEALAAQKKL